jgi:long-chain acyl-CoA synthetase
MPDPATLNDLFLAGTAFGKARAILYPENGRYLAFSHARFHEEVRCLSMGLRALGCDADTPVALLAENSWKWAAMDYAILAAGGVTVPIYAAYPPAYVRDHLARSHARLAAVSTRAQLEKVLALRSVLPDLQGIILMEGADPAAASWEDVKARGRKFMAARGDDFEARARERKPGDAATLLFTSGTAGVPKGILLTHRNILSDVLATAALFDLNPKDTSLTFLPLSHILERMVNYAFFICGVTIAYGESMERIAPNLRQVRPTVFTAVPRLYEKTFARIQDAIGDSALKTGIISWAERVARQRATRRLAGKPLPLPLRFSAALAHLLVYRKILRGLGGRLRFCISGGAPLSPRLAEFFIGAGVNVYEGYGLTETSPVLAVNTARHRRIGSVGLPLPCVEMRLAPDGEILVRGPNVFAEYYEDPETTREAFTGDGFFRTGDVGRFDDEGFLFITDRKKDILVTAGGKNIAPQPIENRLKTMPGIQHAILLGDRRPYPVALIIPDMAQLQAWAAAQGIADTAAEALVDHPLIQARYAALMEEACRPLPAFERPKKFVLLPQELTLEGGLLTPTLKIRRSALARRFASVIDQLYGKDSA